MTSESTPPGMPESSPPPAPPPAAQSTPSPMSEAMSDAKSAMDRKGFSTPEGMVALSVLVLLGVEVVFGLILEEHFNSFVLLVLSILALLIFMGRTATAEKLGPIPVIMKTIGYVIAIYGAIVFVYDLRDAVEIFDNFAEVLAAVLSYGAFVLAYLGARSIKI